MPKISVIVPVYNVEPFLRECVDSILDQTFKDFELILVDDGSPDNCPLICDEYAKKDKRVFVIHKENGGLSSARNAGLDYVFKQCNSEYISFIDSDDYVDKNYLLCLITAIKEYDIAICQFDRVDKKHLVSIDKYDLMGTHRILDNKQLMDEINFDVVFVVAWNKLYRRHLFKDIRYPIGKNHEDEFVIHKLIGEIKKAILISDVLYHYRFNENSITNTEKKREHIIYELEIYSDRAIYLYSKNNFLKQAIANYRICLKLLLDNFKVFKQDQRYLACFKIIKKLYKSMCNNKQYKKSKGESFFFSFPSFYIFVKK